jgi:hypothetical protein
MGDFLSEVYYLVVDILRGLAGELIAWTIVILFIGVPIAVVAYYSLKRGLGRRGIQLDVHWDSRPPQGRPISRAEKTAVAELLGLGQTSPEVAQSLDRTRATLSVQAGEPQVEVLDQQAIDRLRELSRQGASLDEICRQIQPEYDQWIPFRQQAFQKVVEAVVRHYSGGGGG